LALFFLLYWDRKNPGNSGNAKAEYNLLLTAQLFSTKKGKDSENYLPQTHSDVSSAGKKEGFLS